MPETITLIPAGDGLYTEPGTDVTWVKTEYTEPREAEDECVVCEKLIEDWQLWLCMDGGEAAHIDCVEVRTP